MKTNTDPKNPVRAARDRRGSSLVTVIVMTAILAGLAGAAMTFTTSSVNEVERERRETQALYLAEAGVNEAIASLAVSHQTGSPVGASVGTMATPVEDSTGDRWTTITDNGDGSFTILSTGIVGRSDRSIEVVMQPMPPGPFEHAIFAGNLDNDPAYELKVNGSGGQADKITGNVFSGGDITVAQDGEIVGEVRSGGVVTGTTGQSGVRVDIPMTLEVDYEEFNDFDVAELFEGATARWDNAGGTAYQLPESSPVHFMRKNPSDRRSDTSSTTKDDYFLEDPYETVSADYGETGSSAYDITIPEEANNSVIFVDGNLWIHNRRTMSFKMKSAGVDPTRVTFVVKGNVYFSDNFFYDDPDQDGVAFIAIADDDVEDSGNVYFGDPAFGTMRFAEAVMFAENNFYDNNLSASGSSKVKIRGNMTAANQVAIQRDFDRGDGTISHTQLELEFDPRQGSGAISLPGIPVETDHPVGYQVAAWREVVTPRAFELVAPEVEAKTALTGGGVTEEQDDSKGWRKRWKEKYGKNWKVEKRKNKWKKKQEKKRQKAAEKEAEAARKAAEEEAARAAEEAEDDDD